METKKKSNIKKFAVAATVLGTLFYLFNRAKINILNVDQTLRVVKYKVTLGFKTIAGEINLNQQVNQEHDFYGTKLTISTKGRQFITFKIVDKNGKQLDHVEIEFSENSIPQILIPEGTVIGNTGTNAEIKNMKTMASFLG